MPLLEDSLNKILNLRLNFHLNKIKLILMLYMVMSLNGESQKVIHQKLLLNI